MSNLFIELNVRSLSNKIPLEEVPNRAYVLNFKEWDLIKNANDVLIKLQVTELLAKLLLDNTAILLSNEKDNVTHVAYHEKSVKDSPISFGSFEWSPDLKITTADVVVQERKIWDAFPCLTFISKTFVQENPIFVTIPYELSRKLTNVPELPLTRDGEVIGKVLNGETIVFNKPNDLLGKTESFYSVQSRLKKESEKKQWKSVLFNTFDPTHIEQPLGHLVDLDVALLYPKPLMQRLMTEVIDAGYEIVYRELDFDWVKNYSNDEYEVFRLNGHYAIDLNPNDPDAVTKVMWVVKPNHYISEIIVIRSSGEFPNHAYFENDVLVGLEHRVVGLGGEPFGLGVRTFKSCQIYLKPDADKSSYISYSLAESVK